MATRDFFKGRVQALYDAPAFPANEYAVEHDFGDGAYTGITLVQHVVCSLLSGGAFHAVDEGGDRSDAARVVKIAEAIIEAMDAAADARWDEAEASDKRAAARKAVDDAK